MRGVGLLAVAALVMACASPTASTALPAEQAARSVVAPLRFGWVNSLAPSGPLPSSIAVGGPSSGRVLLYFEFPSQASPRRLLRAELVLAVSGPGKIDAELWRAEAPRAGLARWADQPRALYPRVAARLSGELAQVRLDVSEIWRAQRRADEPLRLLLRVEPSSAEALLVQTGASGGGVPPRLEAYWE